MGYNEDLNELLKLDDHFNVIVDRLHESDLVDSTTESVTRRIEETQDAIIYAQENACPEMVKITRNAVDLFTAWAGQKAVLLPMMKGNKEAQHRRAEHNEKLARIDALTQSGNRLAFSERLKETMKHQKKDPEMKTAVFLFDLDRFKGLNDDFGHDTGDKVLQVFAGILKDMTRGKDRALEGDNDLADRLFFPPSHRGKGKDGQSDFRFGGDEFALIMNIRAEEGVDPAEVFARIEERMKEKLATCSAEYKGKTFPLLASVGMHVIGEGDTAETACKAADDNLMLHKGSKKQRYDYCLTYLKGSGAPNVQEVEDKRGNEVIKQRMEDAGAALVELSKDGGVRIHVPAASAAQMKALEALRAIGPVVVYDEAPEVEPPDLS
ncbi:MAG: hypothetical protein COA45_01415 [Zetaproteobacteria bacterium]|nr:MAG: hypothetical protein COA45_01415 [Zetaproteobacteria bacterium]